MTPEEIAEIRMNFTAANARHEERMDRIQTDLIHELRAVIMEQAAQIEALKDKLLLVKCEKIYWSLHGTGHPEEKSTPVQYEEEARKQLKAEMPGMDW